MVWSSVICVRATIALTSPACFIRRRLYHTMIKNPKIYLLLGGMNPDRFHIINVLGSKRDEMLTVQLVKTYCLPSLLCGCEIRNLNTSDARSVDVAWNNASRKIFKGFWRESVKPLQFYCRCLPVTMLIALRKVQFWKKMYYHDSIVSHFLANECYHSVLAVAARYYNISAYHVMHSNNFALNNVFWLHFTTLVKDDSCV